MSPSAGMMLLQQIVPLIAGAIVRGAVKPTGCEDTEELKAEGCALAAALLDSAEGKGKVVAPASIAYYALQALKSGRRSGYAGRTDAMSAAAQLDGLASFVSIDEPVGKDENGDPYDLHSVIADWHEDGSHEAARRLDWDLALQAMDARMRDIVQGTAEGVATNELAVRYQVTAPRICQVRETAGERIKSAWGGDPIEDAGREAGWAKHVRTHAQRRACRAERAAAWNA